MLLKYPHLSKFNIQSLRDVRSDLSVLAEWSGVLALEYPPADGVGGGTASLVKVTQFCKPYLHIAEKLFDASKQLTNT